MIDPKMLELSVYATFHIFYARRHRAEEAVVALKWTVREMERRYSNMAKLGVEISTDITSR